MGHLLSDSFVPPYTLSKPNISGAPLMLGYDIGFRQKYLNSSISLVPLIIQMKWIPVHVGISNSRLHYRSFIDFHTIFL